MKRISKVATVLTLFVGGALGAQAVPAYPGVLTMTQPDGSSIRVRLYGDERGHYYTTENGRMVLETADGFRYACLDAEGVFTPGELVTDGNARLAANPAEQATMIKKAQAGISAAPARHPYVNRTAETRQAPARQLENGMVYPGDRLPGLFPGSDFPTIGSPKVLVLMVQYSDVHFSTGSTDMIKAQITQRNYKERGFTGSALDYYADASKGQFTPQFDVVGPITLPNTQAYYGAHGSDGSSDVRPREMVIHGCQGALGEVNFADYDNNHDGFVDNVYVIYAGRGEASGGGANTIWPHSWVIPEDMSPVFDGVKLGSYACGNELTASGVDAIGTFCHEFGHVLGLPDLYSTSYKAENHPGIWALMASGSYVNDSKTPPTLSAWERSALGWLKPIILERGADYELPASLLNTNQAYVIPTNKANEYFTLENRQWNRDDWDHYIPSWGMLVWHIDYQPRIWNYNIVNDDADHQYANIVEAHGNEKRPGSSMFVCFPCMRYHSFTENTTPALKAWDGSLTDITLTSITEDEDTDDDELFGSGNVYFTAYSRAGFNSVAGIDVDSQVTFATDGMTLRVDGADVGQTVILYTADGRVAACGLAGTDIVVPARGLYIAVCGSTSAKLRF